MYELFYKYLILNGKACLPGIGCFNVQQVPATMDFENKKLNPPSQTINLSGGEWGDNGSFYQYLAKELNITEVEATAQLEQFSQGIQAQANQYGSVLLPGIGRIKRGYMGSFDIEQETENKQVLPDLWISKTQAANTGFMEVYSEITPTIIRRENYVETHETIVAADKDDYWWVYAIILAVMGLGALLYYYI